MGMLYFARHGEPSFPGGGRICLGRLDLPLSALGRLQAAALAHGMREIPLEAVFSSPLQRARQTAEFLHRPCGILEGLQEIDTGDWDGRTFEEIRKKWPKLYEARGENRLLPFPHAEPPGLSLFRFLREVGTAARGASGNVLFVSHAGILCAFLAVLKHLPPLEELPFLGRAEAEQFLASGSWKFPKPPYGSVASISVGEKDGRLALQEWGRVPRSAPSRAFCLALLEASGVPGHIVRHMKAVASKAEELLAALEGAGCRLRREIVLPAALLHDIARLEGNHAARGGEYLEQLGYPEIARVVRAHHDLPPDAGLEEGAIVFLADKLVMEDRPVSLEERFGKSLAKCRTAEQKSKHEGRFRAACRLAEKVNGICGREIARI